MASSAKTLQNRLREERARVASLETELADLRHNLETCIWIDPERKSGQPCIGGHRLPVSCVIGFLEHDGEQGVLAAYPQLTVEQVRLARWYHDRFADTDRTCRWPRPVIHIDPGVQFGHPMINGSPCEVLAGTVSAGDPVELVADEFNATRADVLISCWWLGMAGPPEWQHAWGSWAQAAHSMIAAGRYDEVPDPPPGPEVCEDCDHTRCVCAGEDDADHRPMTTITVAGGLL